MLRRSPTFLAALAVAASVGAAACNGPVTEEDLQLWSRNDVGFARIGEVVADPTQPLVTRVRALEVVVEKGFPTRIRGMIDEVGKGRDELVQALVQQLMTHLDDPKSPTQTLAKDALIALQRYVTPEQFKPVQDKIAKWAFARVTWQADADVIKHEIESRISSGQIRDLGPYGWEGAAILISHGFLVDKMLDFLTGALPDQRAGQLILRALKLLHVRIGVQPHHIEAIGKIGTADAAGYLLDLYLNDKLDQDLRIVAYNEADALMKKKGLKGIVEATAPQLFKMMDGSDPDDRWLGALQLVHLEGARQLDKVLAEFKDDKIYGSGQTDAARQAMDFCLDIYDAGQSTQALPVFRKHLRDPNRIIAAISIVCVKANRDVTSGPTLQAIADEWAKKKPEDQLSLNDFLGENITMGALAQNAAEGLKMLTSVAAERSAGKLNATEFKNKSLITIFELALVGDEYGQAIAKRYVDWHALYLKDPSKFDEGKTKGAKKAGTKGAKKAEREPAPKDAPKPTHGKPKGAGPKTK